jgi:hypothetical protein
VVTAQSTEFILGSSGDPLPVKLLNFKAINEKKNVNLKWSTVSEINNDFFTVERSDDGVDWVEIANLKGAGNSNKQNNYSTFDYFPVKGQSYYRLKQTDFDGKYSYSDVETVFLEGNVNADILLYPNPINRGGIMKIESTSVFTGNIIVIIRDITGREVFIESIDKGGDRIIEVQIGADLSLGTYFVLVESDNQLYSQKIVVK